MNFQRGSILLLVLVLAGCKKTPPANVAATVNSRAITYAELDKQYNVQFPQAGPAAANDDGVLINKLEVLHAMIDQEIMMQRAEKQGLLAPETDVDVEFNKLKSPYTQEEFQKQLVAKKMTTEDLKSDIREKLSIEKLINKEITSKINITEKDIADFYAANRASFNLAEPTVHLAQILVTPNPDAEFRNLKNDKAQDDDQARRKMQNIEQRLRSGEDFSMLAQNYSEDPGSSANGGDLGFVAESSLAKASADLRRLIAEMKPGQVSNIIKTGEGYRILKLLSKEPAGQRELTDPRVQQTIRETLLNRKDQLLRGAYLEAVRNEAQVENQLARTTAQIAEKK
ncbi:MAG: peptidylprolyl isomerase [Acidobacteria bacterium]|nr:peptidylprolyl isomerase [Acidobacteriota bacterium]